MEKNSGEKKELLNVILKLSFKEGDKVKLTCDSALTVAEQFGVKPSEVGSICNDQNIRLCQCQLGCFK